MRTIVLLLVVWPFSSRDRSRRKPRHAIASIRSIRSPVRRAARLTQVVR